MIAIIGILIGMLLPAVQSVRAAARRSACQNNLRQIGLGLLNYESAHQKFPPGQSYLQTEDGDEDRIGYSWFVQILPQLEAGNLHDMFDLDLPPTDTTNRFAMAQPISFALCPSTAMIDGDRDNEGMIPQFVTDTVTDPFDMACLDYMGIVGPKDGDNDILNSNGEEYDRNAGMLVKLKKRDDEQIGLVSPRIKISEVSDGTSNTTVSYTHLTLPTIYSV